MSARIDESSFVTPQQWQQEASGRLWNPMLVLPLIQIH
jgi:hypothetical protein